MTTEELFQLGEIISVVREKNQIVVEGLFTLDIYPFISMMKENGIVLSLEYNLARLGSSPKLIKQTISIQDMFDFIITWKI